MCKKQSVSCRVQIFVAIAIIAFSLASFLAPAEAEAAIYYINGVSGNDTNGGSIEAPWKTIHKANNTLVAGDTVYIRGGTYSIGNLIVDGGNINSQGIRPNNSGTRGGMITYSAYPGEIVSFVGIGDGTRTRAGAINLDDRSYIRVTGNSGYNMTFSNMTSNFYIGYNTAGHFNEIDHCDFGSFYGGLSLDEVNYRGSTIQHGSQYNHIHDNKIHDWQIYTTSSDGPVCLEIGEENGTSATSYNLIENNTLYHCGHHVVGLEGKYNIFRNNIIHNENYYQNNGKSYGYRNFQAGSGMADYVGNHLIEGNRFGPSGISMLSEYLDGLDGRGTQRGGTSFYLNSSYNIARYNYLFGALGMSMNFRRYTGGEVKHNTVYNNTFYYSGYSTENDIECSERFPINLSYSPSYIEYNTVKNNLFHSTWPQTNYEPQQTGCGIRPITPVIGGALTTMTVESNLEATGSANLHFANPDISDTMSPVLPDLSLLPDSGAINGGSYLTRANNSGLSSKNLSVDNAHFFQDANFGQEELGWSDSMDIEADWLAIGSPNNVVQIDSINHTSNTITLTSPISWQSNDPVWLYKKSDGTRVLYGAGPDYGAYEYSSENSDNTPPVQPAGLQVQ